MRRELLDALRCPAPHEESWLVAVVARAGGGVLVEADLACPLCGAEFRITDGIARFGPRPAPAEQGAAPTLDVDRLAALLGVTQSDAPILLAGAYASAGTALAAVADAPQLWLDAPDGHQPDSIALSRFEGAARMPLGVDTLAGAAVDTVHAGPALLESIGQSLRVGARLVAPAAAPVPSALTELARDDQEWVAERTVRASGLIELRRRG